MKSKIRRFSAETLSSNGAFIAGIRKEQGFLQSEFSSILGISENLAVDIEAGKPSVKLGNLLNYINECGIEMIMRIDNREYEIQSSSLIFIGQIIKETRKNQRLTQIQLTDIVGISHSLGKRIEQGNEKVVVKNWLNYVENLGIELILRD